MSLRLLKAQELSQQLGPCLRASTSPVVGQVSSVCFSKEIRSRIWAFLIPVGLQDVELLRRR